MRKVFIIAEAGVNHNGSIKKAKKMVDVAADAGADAVKFQTFNAESLVSECAPKAGYQAITTNRNEKQLGMIKKLELDLAAHKELLSYCRKKKIIFLSSPFDLKSIGLLSDMGLNIFKIPSGEITDLPYLRKIGSLRKRIIISTGMASLAEIGSALKILISAGTLKKNITVLQCNTEYPTPYDDANLSAMRTIKRRFGLSVGYSDHTAGLEVPVAAVALGAEVIEKHFTLDKNMPGPDHKASLDPEELKKMVQAVRHIEKALGNGIKKPSRSEKKNIFAVRKSIVALKDICKGDIFTDNNITAKRPGSGINPMRWNEVIGKRAKEDFMKDDLISV